MLEPRRVQAELGFAKTGKRREQNWLAMTDPAIASFGIFTAVTTTRGFTGHEMVDPVGLVHMNGRVYDPEIGRFLSADPFVQDLSNLQALNRYSYVLNNPLSYTDPSGYFFKKLFQSIGKALSGLFRAVGNVLKAVLKNPIVRAVIQIVGCASTPFTGPAGGLACAGIGATLTLASGGSVADALKAFAFSFASFGIFDAVGPAMKFLQEAYGVAGTIMKAGVHGVIGGALSVAQGGSFMQGFVGSAMGVLGGAVAGGSGNGESGLFGRYGDGNTELKLARALVSGAAGCAGALLTGGKCAEAGLTAAFASLYNADRSFNIDLMEQDVLGRDADAHNYAHIGRSRASMIAQMQNEQFDFLGMFGGYRQTLGSFPSYESANKLVNSTLSQNADLVHQFVRGELLDDRGRALSRMSVHSSFNSPTGIEASRASQKSSVEFRDTFGVRAVLYRAPELAQGFRVQTSFPTRR